jgi:hypothetical protein
MSKNFKLIISEKIQKINIDSGLLILIKIILSGMGFAYFFNFILMGKIFNFGYPKGTFFFKSEARFSDFTDVLTVYSTYFPGRAIAEICYFPFMYLFISPLKMIHEFLFSNYYLVNLTFILVFFYSFFHLSYFSFGKNLKNRIILSALLLISYPVIFALDRGNFEVIVFLGVVLFFIFYIKKNFLLSCFFLSMSISMKLIPAIFLYMFLSKKHLKYFLLTLIFVLSLTILGILYQPESPFNVIERLLENLKLFNFNYAYKIHGLYFSHSFWGFLTLIFKIHLHRYQVSFDVIERIYLMGVLILAGWGLYLLTLIRKTYERFEEQNFQKSNIAKIQLSSLVLVILMCLIPQVSSAYRLIYFTIPLILIFSDKDLLKNKFILVCLAVLFIPKHYLFLPNKLYGGILLDPIIMFLILNKIRSQILNLYGLG